MRVGIDASFLKYPHTGVGQHLIHLLDAFGEIGGSNSYAPLSPRGDSWVNRRLKANLRQVVWEQLDLPVRARRGAVDILHVPYFSPPLITGKPTIITIHDTIPFLFPEYRRGLGKRLYLQLLQFAARRAAAIITVSENSKQDILRLLGIGADRIRVIPNGLDGNCRRSPIETVDVVLSKFNIGSNYLLYFGGFERRKNIAALINSYALLPRDILAEFELVLAGNTSFLGHPLYPDPRPEIARVPFPGRVVLVGDVPENEKIALYSGATMCVFPSLYEGFGLPVLEAMGCGAPVATANRSALPEVAGEAAVFFNPDDVNDIAHAIERLLQDTQLRENLRVRGLDRARRFSWSTSAHATLDVYAEVYGN